MKKSIKVIFALIISVVTIFSVTACNKEVFYKVNGLTILLDDSFKQVDDQGVTVFLENDDCFFLALRESIKEVEAAGYEKLVETAVDYADVIIDKNQYNAVATVNNRRAFFECETNENGVTYYNSFMVLNGADRTYWTCRFMCESSKKDKYKAKFSAWLETVLV